MKKAFSRQSSVFRLSLVCFVLLLLLQPAACSLSPIFAADSTQSATQSADIKSKIKILQEEIASRAAGMKSEVTKKLQNKAYIGTVKIKNNNSLVLSVKDSKKIVNVNEFTEYVIKSKKSIGAQGLKNITEDSTIAALGDIDDKGTLSAKRIIKLNSPIPLFPKIVNGIITAISNGKVSLQTVRKDQFSIVFDKNTDYQTGKTKGSFDDIKTNKWIVVSGESSVSTTSSANPEVIEASYVYIFPNSITAKPKITTTSAVKKAI